MPADTAPSFLERLRGKRTTDIELPTPKGARRDPRLPKKKQSNLDKMVEGFDLFKGLSGKKEKK